MAYWHFIAGFVIGFVAGVVSYFLGWRHGFKQAEMTFGKYLPNLPARRE